MRSIGQYTIKKKVSRGLIQYTLHWSPYYLMDKYVINQFIPSEGGIYQLFSRRSHHLEELETAIAYYGGIRGTMREMTDELSPRVFAHKSTVLKEACFCRFVTCPSRTILNEALEYLNGSAAEDSKIEVTEKDHLGLVLKV